MVVPYLATAGAFLIIDAFWLKAVMKPIFEADVPHLLQPEPKLAVAAGFYAIFAVGIVYFAVAPGAAAGSVGLAAFNGAVLGAMAYGTYEATNMATLRGWTWRMLAIDVAWGAALSALSATIGVLAALHI
jgi:uncharacterized membrane protein